MSKESEPEMKERDFIDAKPEDRNLIIKSMIREVEDCFYNASHSFKLLGGTITKLEAEIQRLNETLPSREQLDSNKKMIASMSRKLDKIVRVANGDEKEFYYLFGGKTCYYAQGGARDFIAKSTSLSDLKDMANDPSRKLDWYQISDEDCNIVASSEAQPQS